jgi:hypothetical protein
MRKLCQLVNIDGRITFIITSIQKTVRLIWKIIRNRISLAIILRTTGVNSKLK